MEKEIKRSRTDRRKSIIINEKFDSLLDPCLYAMALYGDTEEVATLISNNDSKWRAYVHKHNNNRKSGLHVDPGALLNQIGIQMTNSKRAAEVLAKEEDRAAYDRWVAKQTLRNPRTMWWWNKFAKVKKNYVEEKYAKLKSQSSGRTGQEEAGQQQS